MTTTGMKVWRNAIAALVIGAAASAQAAPVTDCPLRDAPFSLDSPVIDIHLSPAATAVLHRVWPASKSLWSELLKTQPPSFGAITTVRSVAGGSGRLPQLEAELRALPVTDEDRAARCARYDNDTPPAVPPTESPRVLVFEKVNGFLHGEAIKAARVALKAMALRRGWSLTFTDRGGAMTPEFLRHFKAVVWNNVSGDVLTLSQRAAFRAYVEGGGGFVGFHGSGGDPEVFWDWYADTLVGARFKGHPMKPQFQEARIRIEERAHAIVAGLGEGWTMSDEWYSFRSNPRASGARVLATLDEKTYEPGDLAMGDDHPIVWTRCVGQGRAFYSAIGHRGETYAEPSHVKLLEQAVAWAATRAACQAAPAR